MIRSKSSSSLYATYSTFSFLLLFLLSCSTPDNDSRQNDTLTISVSRTDYADKLEGFWLGQCIANWTGLITEMDKIGNIGDIKTGAFYTRKDWGTKDLPNIWSEGEPSTIRETIDFVLLSPDTIWGADDDTDIEYIYQELMLGSESPLLTGEQIRDAWLQHIRPDEENYLWVSNQQAYDLMRKGVIPPHTSDTARNPHYEMIDAQLTTEIFGLYAPCRSDIARQIAHMPIRTSAREEAAEIAEFYVTMYSAVSLPNAESINAQLFQAATIARSHLSPDGYPAAMFDNVLGWYRDGVPWEAARDSVYQRYQVDQADGYDITSKGLYCNGCFAAGINFAASLISLFYGEGDFRKTVRIAVLCGWDSDNPAATWGGLLGFLYGREELEQIFGQNLSMHFDIHRTRTGFPDDGKDSFPQMAQKGIRVTDKVVTQLMNGSISPDSSKWFIPVPQNDNPQPTG